jgi:hypothetical protein
MSNMVFISGRVVMKKVMLLVVALLGANFTECYSYKIINKTSQQIGYDISFVNPGGLCPRLLNTVGAGKEFTDNTARAGSNRAGCLATNIEIISGSRKSSRSLRLRGGAGRAGNMTFLIFEKNDGTGPYIQWENGIVSAWDPCGPGKNTRNCKVN